MKLEIQKKRIKKKDRLEFVILTIMYSSATLGVINREILSFNTIILLKYLSIIFGAIFFLNSYRIKYSRGNDKIALPSRVNNVSLLALWTIYSSVVIISQAYNGYLPLEGIVSLFFNPVVYFIVIPKVLDRPEHTIIMASFYSSFIYLVLSALYEPIVFGRYYSGVTYNPNSLGQLAVQAAVSSLCLLLESLKRRDLKKRVLLIHFIYFIYFIISILFVFLSRSRTSFLATLLPIFIALSFYLILGRVKLKKILIPVGLFVIVYIIKLKELFYIGIIDKFDKFNSEQLLTGRDYIWKKIFDDMALLGHGNNYFNEEIGRGAHNSILEIVGGFGLIAGAIMALFYITSVIIAFKYTFIMQNKQYFFLPIIIVLAFVILSMAESMFGVIGKSMTLVYLNIIGVMIFRNYKSQ